MTVPAEYDLTTSLWGSDLKIFVENLITKNDAYELDQKTGIVMKKYIDCMSEPNDLPSYANYHLQLKQKTNSLD